MPHDSQSSDAHRIEWLEWLLFVALSALMFTALLEWSRYELIVGWVNRDLFVRHKIVIFWLLWAKTLVMFLPMLALIGVLLLLRLQRFGKLILALGWTGLMCWLSVDLLLMSYTGSHVSEYMRYALILVYSPDKTPTQYAGGGVAEELMAVLATVVFAGLVIHRVARIIMRWAVARYPELMSATAMGFATLLFVVLAVGIVPIIAVHEDNALFRRIYWALPLDENLLEGIVDRAAEVVAMSQGVKRSDLSAESRAPDNQNREKQEILHSVLMENAANQHVSLDGVRIQNERGDYQVLTGDLEPNQTRLILLPIDTFPKSSLLLMGEKELLPFKLRWASDAVGLRLKLTLWEEKADTVAQMNDRVMCLRLLRESIHPAPVDSSAFVDKTQLPNVIFMVVESFRHAAFNPDLMPKLHTWSRKGLHLDRHYSSSNTSHLSLFSILYGRVGLAYDTTLALQIPAQMCESLRRSGYSNAFLTSGECSGWVKMEQYLSESNFDFVLMPKPGEVKDYHTWPEADRNMLARIRSIASENSNASRFVFAFMSTAHYPYVAPQAYERFQPCGVPSRLAKRDLVLTQLTNRYQNAMLFLDGELSKLIESLDPQKNIIIVTGDHGESIGEDGVFGHSSRASEAQTRVPFMMVGPGVSSQAMDTATGHADILPTLLHVLSGRHVPIKHCHGRDLLQGEPPNNEVIITPCSARQELVVLKDNTRSLFLGSNGPSGLTMSFRDHLDENGLIMPVTRQRTEGDPGPGLHRDGPAGPTVRR